MLEDITLVCSCKLYSSFLLQEEETAKMEEAIITGSCEDDLIIYVDEMKVRY